MNSKHKSNNNLALSKYLSYVLRHHPEAAGLKLMTDGWVDTYKLLTAIAANSGYKVDLNRLKEIVNTDEKQRYSFKEMHGDPYALIRANQGHSVKELKMNYKELIEEELPDYVYHGTSKENANKILESGEIKPMSRQMVHLSKDIETATKVGKRHGELAIFKVDCKKAFHDGKRFYISENGVYLVDRLDIKYTELM